ncbi:hypothetical protein [Flavobacterium sp. 3HN19-14]|uniref:hypothetical protein n=1 Tax=Flavobacterium sp. 3HN19-14 TaxID=3448133 RepID=UPI003EE41A0B
MKNQFLKLNNPCSENWDNMTPNSTGSFCDVCAKNVIDFTKLSPLEIAQQMKKANGSLCARVTSEQLRTPLPIRGTDFSLNFPYSNIAAGVMIAGALAACQPSQAKDKSPQTEIASSKTTAPAALRNNPLPPSPTSSPDDFTTFKGMVYFGNGQVPVKNARITLVTVGKIISAYSGADGKFTLDIPNESIDNDNVIRVSYNEIVKENKEDVFDAYETRDYILSKKQLATFYKVEAKELMLVAGGIGMSASREPDPVVLSADGGSIKYSEYLKAYSGKKSSCNLNNKETMYFSAKEAVAIYGKKAAGGLIILTDK